MPHSRIATVACISFLLSALAGGPPVVAANQPTATVEGSLVANGETVQLPYVYAYAEKKGFYDESDPTWEVLFAAKPIAERDLDDTIWDSAYVRLGITKTATFDEEPKLQIYSQNIRFPGESSSNISGGSYPQLELSITDPDRLAGRVYHTETQEFFDDTFQFDFTFDAPLSDPFGPLGDPLPADGGEPGAAYLAWTKAIQAGDVQQLKKLVPADKAEMLDGEDVKETLEFLAMMTPTDVTIVGGSSDGQTAILLVTGTMDGESVEGEITLILEEGFWIATETAWK
ncbi:MAG: hypothetical protein GY906_30240 [bacterium]|nr:hypothetical protein [bacterium]